MYNIVVINSLQILSINVLNYISTDTGTNLITSTVSIIIMIKTIYEMIKLKKK